MICATCQFYRRQGQGQPIAPVCTWRPSPEVLEQLRAMLPSPMLSRALVMASPVQVEGCGVYQSLEVAA
jgi:hypothetical protein